MVQNMCEFINVMTNW